MAKGKCPIKFVVSQMLLPSELPKLAKTPLDLTVGETRGGDWYARPGPSGCFRTGCDPQNGIRRSEISFGEVESLDVHAAMLPFTRRNDAFANQVGYMVG